MNSEPEDIPESVSESPSSFMPQICLALAFLLFLGAEVYSSWREASFLKSQEAILTQQVEQAQVQLAQARTIQTLLEGIAGDLLIMSHNDSEIRKIVEKYQIRKNAPPATPPSN